LARLKKREIILDYQPYADIPQLDRQGLYTTACRNDDITVDSWRETWLGNIRANHKRFGGFKNKSIGLLHGKHKYKAGLIMGSGPHLKYQADVLAKNPGIPTVSCLHNFHFCVDNNIPVDYFVTLDAGPVTIEEVSEGGKESEDFYWEATKDKTLIAFIGTDPRLLEKWQGEIYFYNSPLPNKSLVEEIDAIEKFRVYISNGGNVLGACLYFAKAFLGCNPIIFTGASFSFDYDSSSFHAWGSKYDGKLGRTVRMTDVFGNKVHSWASYAGFKSWFDWVCETKPGIWINATEGGCLGSYPEGNLRSIIQMDLEDVFDQFDICRNMKDQADNPDTEQRRILF
jgi:hypothetical protein